MCIRSRPANTHKRSRHQAEQLLHMFPAKPVTPNPSTFSTADSGKAKKSVTFCPMESTVASYIPARSDLSDEEKCGVWLCPAELNNIKHRASETFQHLRELQHLGSGGATTKGEASDKDSLVLRRYREPRTQQQQQRGAHHPHTLVDEEDLSFPRGFEGRLSVERMRNRVVANRAVLQYSRQLREEFAARADQSLSLALLSSQLSRWSREIALSMGQADFLDAYEVFRGVIPQPKTEEEIGTEHPFPPVSGVLLLRKRASNTMTEEEGRRVRRRVCC